MTYDNYADQANEQNNRIKFCVFKLKLSNYRKGFRIEWPEEVKGKTVKEIVDTCFNNNQILSELRKDPTFSLMYNEAKAACSDPVDCISKAKEAFVEMLNDSLSAKRTNIMGASVKGTHSSFAYEDVQEVHLKSNFNDIDDSFFNFLIYNKKDGFIYAKHDGKTEVVGTKDRLAKSLPDSFITMWKENADAVVGDSDAFKHEYSDYILFIMNKARIATDEFIRLLNCQIHAQLQNEEKTTQKNPTYYNKWNVFEYDENFTKIENPSITFIVSPKDVSSLRNDEFDIETVLKAYAVDYFLANIPATIFATGYIKMQFRYNVITSDDDSNSKFFSGLSFKWTKFGTSFNDEFWIKYVFTNHMGDLMRMYSIDSVIKTYTDDVKEMSMLTFNEEYLKTFKKTHPFYSKLDECSTLMTLRKWMTPFEFKALMAWAYTAIRPTTARSDLAMMVYAGGGTGKSTFYRLLEKTISVLASADVTKFSQRLLGYKFDSEDYNVWNPNGEIGICKAAIINIDETTNESLEIFKNFSGTPGGNKITGRKIYSEASSDITYAKWYFSTNKALELTNDDGSFQRRLVIISHPETKNLVNINGMPYQEFEESLNKEIPVFYEVAKKSYELLTAEGKSLDEVLMNNEELSNNLKASVGAEANEDIFRIVEKMIHENEGGLLTEYNNSYRVGVSWMKKYYEKACKITGNNPQYFGSFSKFLKSKIKYSQQSYVNFINDKDESDFTGNSSTLKCYIFEN